MRPDRPKKPKNEGPAYTWDEALPADQRPAAIWEYAARPLWVQAMPEAGAVLLLEKEQVLLRDAQTGAERWKQAAKELPDEVLADARGIYLAAGRDFRSLDPATGAARWRQTQGGVVTGMVADRDTVYLSTRGPLLALNRADGKPRWKAPCAWEPVLHLCPEAGVLLIDNPETDTVECVETASGARRWEFESEGQPVTVGALLGGAATLSCHGNGVVSADLQTGEVRWRVDTGGVFEAPAVALDNRLFLTDGKVRAVDPANGETLWTRELVEGEDPVFVVRAAGDLLLAETWKGRILALDPADGSLRWEHRLGQVHGVTRGPRHLYLRVCNPDGSWTALALDPASGQPAWSLQSATIVPDLTVIGEVLVVELRNRVLILKIGV